MDFQFHRDQWKLSQATGPHDVLHGKGALFSGHSCAIKMGDETGTGVEENDTSLTRPPQCLSKPSLPKSLPQLDPGSWAYTSIKAACLVRRSVVMTGPYESRSKGRMWYRW